MNCGACQTRLPLAARYCPACGIASIKEPGGCVRCGSDLRGDERFCTRCGTSVAVALCFSCGTWNPVGEERCRACRSPLQRPVGGEASEATPELEGPLSAKGGVPTSIDAICLRIQPPMQRLRRSSGTAATLQAWEGLRKVLAPHAQALNARLLRSENGAFTLLSPLEGGRGGEQARLLLERLPSLRAALGVLDREPAFAGSASRCLRYVLHQAWGLSSIGEPLLIDQVEGAGAALAAVCPEGEVVVDGAVRALLGRRLRERPLGLARGLKGEPLPVWQVLDLQGAETSGQQGSFMPMARQFRPSEVEQCRELVQSVARQSHPALLELAGLDEIDCAMLVDATLEAALQHDYEIARTTGRGSVTLATLQCAAELVSTLLGIQPEDDEAGIRTRIDMAVQSLLYAEGFRGDEAHGETLELAQALAFLVGGRMGWETQRRDAAMAWRQKVYFAVYRLVRARGHIRPVLWVIEKVNSMDVSSRELLQYLGGALGNEGRLLVVLAWEAITDEEPTLVGTWKQRIRPPLLPPGQRVCAQTLRALLPADKWEDQLTRISTACGGRPGLLLLLVQVWLAARALRPLDARLASRLWAGLQEGVRQAHRVLAPGTGRSGPAGPTSRSRPLPMPVGKSDDDPSTFEEGERDAELETSTTEVLLPGFSESLLEGEGERPEGPSREQIRADLVARTGGLLFEALPEQARRVLEFLSICGPFCRRELLTALWLDQRQDPGALATGLEQLSSRGYLRRSLGGGTWVLGLELLLPGTRATMPSHAVARLHRAVASLIEQAPAGWRERIGHAIVAWHLEQAGESERSLRYRILAGRRARMVASLVEAEPLVAGARRMASRLGQSGGGIERTRITILHGRHLLASGRVAEAREALEEALETARVRHQRALETEALLALCEVDVDEGFAANARERLITAGERAARGNLGRLQLYTVLRVAWASYELGDRKAAEGLLEQASVLAQRLHDREASAQVLEAYAMMHSLAGEHRQAVERMRALAALNQERHKILSSPTSRG